jgi:hypothetical protein
MWLIIVQVVAVIMLVVIAACVFLVISDGPT